MSIQTIDMKDMRYLNLFEKITGVRCKNCFSYNLFLVFGVPTHLVSKAIGQDGKNVKKLYSILKKRVKIVALPENINGAEKFISAIVSPAEITGLEISENEIIITGSMQNKAVIIGRDKVRLKELQKIVKEFFGKELKVI